MSLKARLFGQTKHFIRSTRLGLAALLLSSLAGCAAITITESGPGDFTYYPHYETTKHFFLWGFIGEHSVNTRAACREKRVIQMQTKFTPKDVALAAVTLGLYLPRTARVWCERPEADS